MPFLSAMNRGRGQNHETDVFENPGSNSGAKFLEWLLEGMYGASEALPPENVAE
jgi:hypothetical protein